MQSEVLLLRAQGQEGLRELAWQCLAVEYGIDFAFDDDCQLPSEVPADFTGLKAIAIDSDSWDYYHAGQNGERIKKFLNADGVIFKLHGPDKFQAIDEVVIRGDFEMMLASADIMLDHPRLRERLQARCLRDIYESLREPYFLGQIELGLKRGTDQVFSEPYCYNILQTMELLAEYDPAFGWHERLRATLDSMIPLAPQMPPHTDALAHMGVFVRMSQRTGDSRYLDLATRLVKQVESHFPRIEGVPALMPGRDRIVWNESCAHFPAIAVGTANGDDELLALGIHAVDKIYELNFDPQTQLWRHWGVRREDGSMRHGPACWARGAAWALTAIHGALLHLPAQHPGRPRFLNYLHDTLQGLLRVQHGEGLWHNVLDNPQSRVCVRASAMFCYLAAEARRAGWIRDAQFDAMLHRAWRGVRGRIWRDKLCTVCCGTGAGATYQHYMARPHLFYGAAAALRAGVSYELAFGASDR